MIAASIDELLRLNTGLPQRMERLETHVTRLVGSGRDSENVRLSLEMDRMSSRTLETILGKSRVYRRLEPRPTRCSIDSNTRTTVSSIFANVNLSEISNISVLEVPLWAKDVGSTGYFNTSGFATDKVKASGTNLEEPPKIPIPDVDNTTGVDPLGSGVPGANLQHVLVDSSIQDSPSTVPPLWILFLSSLDSESFFLYGFFFFFFYVSTTAGH